MRAFANLTVIVPADAIETAKAVRACMDVDGPVYIRIGRGFEPRVYESRRLRVPDRQSRRNAARHGRDRHRLRRRLSCTPSQAAKILKQEDGLSVRVLNMHTIKPIDKEAILKAVQDTRRIVTFEDHNMIGGLGAAVAEVIADSGKGCAFQKVGIPDEFTIIGYPEDIQNHYKIDTDGVVEKVREVMGRDFEPDEDWEDEV